MKTESARIIKNETKPDSVVYFPLNQSFLRVIGVSVAAVALFLFVSTPVNNVDSSLSYSASLIPVEMISKEKVGEEREVESITNYETTFGGRQLQITEDNRVVPYVVAQDEEIGIYASNDNVTENEIVAESPPTIKIAETTSSKIYYAIIGSFTSEKQANQFMQQINIPESANMGIVKNEERVRVYAEKFDKREDAQNYILRLRTNEKLKDTWLFVGQ